MPQQTNLNVEPYFDDFDSNNDYHRVLFKPGYPVQARELTTLQTILQDQIEKFGQHFFKEGSKVIPGNTGYSQLYYCVQLNNTHLGIPVSAYADQLVGTKITGQTSGVSAYVDFVLPQEDSEVGNITLYINYLSSSTQNNTTQTFLDSEELVCNKLIASTLIGNPFIQEGTPFATTFSENSTATGSVFQIDSGVYFIRGNFVEVEKEYLILDQYTNTPNYRVGLFISEEVITADIDESLNDNSQGYNNYSAPGADRLKLSVSLFKKPLSDLDDTNFIELAVIEDGVLKVNKSSSSSNSNLKKNISESLSDRSFSDSGSYYIKPFEVSLENSLNDKVGNKGLFTESQFTPSGGIPSDDLSVYKISTGKAYVRGYEVETTSPVMIDVQKPRETKSLENQSLSFNTGSTLSVNRLYGAPNIGIGTSYYVSLRSDRVGAASTTLSGDEIGVARVYDFKLKSNYNSNKDINEWSISLYDLNIFSTLTLNSAVTLSTPTFIKGKNSGATAFLKNSVTDSTSITVYDKKGTFVKNETLSFDGLESSREIVSIDNFGVSNVKSIFSTDENGDVDFSCDTIQSPKVIGKASITAESSGTSTITSSEEGFPKNIYVNDLLQYTISSQKRAAKVTQVLENSIEISSITSVTGVFDGSLPTSNIDVVDLSILKTNLDKSSDKSLFTKLPKTNISNINLNNSNISIRKKFIVDIVNNRITTNTTPSADIGEEFMQFSPSRYSLIRSDGSIEELDFSKVQLAIDSKSLTIVNLGADDTGATLMASLKKSSPSAKEKINNKVSSIIINNSKLPSSGIGITTLNDGLNYGTNGHAFGTRVQDEIISLNTPDAISIHGIFESTDVEDPSSPKLFLSTINSSSSTTSEFIIGERIVGQISGAVAILAEKNAAEEISILYKNENKFKVGESIVLEQSEHSASIISIESPSFDITSNYTFSNGQKNTFYDYSTITRKSDVEEPTRKLKVYFSHASYDATDGGDITTVNSYSNFDYSSEISSIGEIRNTDIIDIRPRVSNFTQVADRSPLEFMGRRFLQQGNTSKNILASGEPIDLDFSYHRGRIDSIFLTKSGRFQVKYGVPSDIPEKPDQVDGTLEIATINLPPYLYDTKDASILTSENKRYTMKDVKHISDRLSKLEKETKLSLLETSTANMFIGDQNSNDRFKSGFFVDDFATTKSQDTSVYINNSIDESSNELRPKHYTTSIGMIPGPVDQIAPGDDLYFSNAEGVNIQKSDNLITLDYSEIECLSQTFATRTENVTPFTVSFWQGMLDLKPRSDDWIDVRKDKEIDMQVGFEPTVWNSWQKNWIGIDNSDIDGISIQGKVLNKIDLKSKSTNIHFESKNIKPNTRMYAFFDGKEVTNYCVPKLLEISMIEGVFQSGETVEGKVIASGLDQKTRETSCIIFRLAQSNHKEGPYNSPVKVYDENPYNNTQLPEIYSATSTVLNVDTLSLSSESESSYYGLVEVGMTLSGRDSGAQAVVTNIRLLSDSSSCLLGSFYIPDSTRISNPNFESGEKTFTLTSSESNDTNDVISRAERTFTSSGIIETVNDNIVSVRSPLVQERPEFELSSVRDAIDTELVSGSSTSSSQEKTIAWYDPLAQSFKVEDETGIFITRCDIFFRTKDANSIPVEMQIRPMKNGVPSEKIIPGTRVAINPEDVQTSADGSIATSFEFKSPVYLEGGNSEYAICLKSNSTKYSVFISKIGEFDIISDSYISNHSYLGPLFKSQNTSDWEANSSENLKFTMYRADFLDSGTVEFYNSELSAQNCQIAKLMPDSLSFKAKKIRAGLSTVVGSSADMDSYALSPGVVYYQDKTNAAATLVGTAATATGTLSITDSGSGYDASATTFDNINLTTITGNGRGAKADVTLSAGEITGATISDGGSGYNIGDVLGITTTGSGSGARLTVATVGETSELVFDNVQGDFVINQSDNKLQYKRTTGVSSDMKDNSEGPVYISNIVTDSDGLHIKINHQNHGMHSNDNRVEIFGVSSDVRPTKLTLAYDSESTSPISIDDTSEFSTFENVGVGTTNTGFLLIEDEIIEYNQVSDTQVGGILRGVNNTLSKSYPSGTPVYKYEINGVNLLRVNKIHNFSDVEVDDPITFDSYHIKLNTEEVFNQNNDDRSNDVGFQKLHANKTKTCGGYLSKATQNIPFEIVTPNIHNLSIEGTSISAQLRTTTGQSQSGDEVPFVNTGFEEISINKPNYLKSPRIICSKVNEDNKLSANIGNKSSNLRLFLSTTNSKLTPIIDSERVSMILTSNRINNIIEDYAEDGRVNKIFTDPTACQYISKEMNIDNPATGLKIILDADLMEENDIRAFYAISDSEGFDPTFVPFSGYEDLNDGKSDEIINKSSGYSEYTFTADSLSSFISYRVKIIMTSKNQVQVPKIKNLKVIALA